VHSNYTGTVWNKAVFSNWRLGELTAGCPFPKNPTPALGLRRKNPGYSPGKVTAIILHGLNISCLTKKQCTTSNTIMEFLCAIFIGTSVLNHHFHLDLDDTRQWISQRWVSMSLISLAVKVFTFFYRISLKLSRTNDMRCSLLTHT